MVRRSALYQNHTSIHLGRTKVQEVSRRKCGWQHRRIPVGSKVIPCYTMLKRVSRSEHPIYQHFHLPIWIWLLHFYDALGIIGVSWPGFGYRACRAFKDNVLACLQFSSFIVIEKRRGAFNYSYGPEQLSSGKQFATEKNIIVIAKSSISSGFYRVCMITFWCLPSGTLWHSYGKWMKMAHLYQGWWFSTVLFVYQRVIFPLGQSIEIYSIVFFQIIPWIPW